MRKLFFAFKGVLDNGAGGSEAEVLVYIYRYGSSFAVFHWVFKESGTVRDAGCSL